MKFVEVLQDMQAVHLKIIDFYGRSYLSILMGKIVIPYGIA